MKGLIRTTLIIVALVAVGVGASAIVYGDLTDDLAVARERGLEEGYAQGHEDGYQEGSKVGYQEGSKVGYVDGNGEDVNSSDEAGFYFVYNPTYGELLEMLAEGEMGSAREVIDYAEINGIRAVYVRCEIARQAAEGMVYIHELVAFETVDKGLVIIEPWSHREVKVEIGRRYSELNGFPLPAYDDTITKVTIVW